MLPLIMPARSNLWKHGFISLSPLSLATDVTDATFRASSPWLGTWTGAGGTATLTESFFWPHPMAPWTTRLF